MSSSLVLNVSSAFIFIIGLWSLLKLRDWQYRRHDWTIWRYEDACFLFGLILALTVHSMLTDHELTAVLSMAPWTIVTIKTYQAFWKRPK